jgi:uncharacterized protein YkwD
MRTVPVLRLAATAAVAALLAGCGSGGQATPDQAPSAPGATAAAPDVTDGRLGGATSAASTGQRTVARGGRIRLGAGAPPRGAREGVNGGASCGAVDAQPQNGELGAIPEATLCLLNAERTSRGLVALTANAKLAQAARAHADDMVAKQYFGHESPSGSTPTQRIRAAGYIPDEAAWTVGENLAWGSGALATPAAIVRAWMNSPGHRDNLLKPAYREIGLAVVAGVPRAGITGGATYATTFGVVEGATSSEPAAAPVSRPAASTSAKPTAAKGKVKKKTKRRSRSARARAAKARAARARAARLRAARK